jgi:hypothetical protein
MSIRVDCPCGRVLKYDNMYANTKTECPSCREPITVPAAGTNTTADTDEGVRTALQDAGKKWGSPQGRDEDYDYERGANPYRTRDVDQRFVKRPPAPSSGGFGSINAGVGGGLAMIAIAIVWFIGGAMFGIIFWYPAVLLVLGIIAVIKGLANSNQ